MSTSQRQISTLGNLRTLNVISPSEFEFLNRLPDANDLAVSIHGVFEIVRRLAEAVIAGELPEDDFALLDRTSVLLKLSEERYFAKWVPRVFSLHGTHLEYQSNKKEAGRHSIHLTPECFCVEPSLKDAKSKHVIALVTRHKVLHLACPSFGEKLCWISSLARAILIPRKRAIGVTQSTLFKGQLTAPQSLGSFPEATTKKLLVDEVVDSEVVKWSPSPKKKAVKKFVVLQKHYLRIYRDRSAFETGGRASVYLVLDHSACIIKRTELALEIRTASDPSAPITILEFFSPQRREEFTLSLEACINFLRLKLAKYFTYYSTRSENRHARAEAAVSRPAPLPDKAEPVKAKTPEPVAPKPVVPAPKEGPKESPKSETLAIPDEERDPRPVVELHARWVNSEGTLGNEETFLAKIHVDVNLPLAVTRDEIFSQVSPDLIPQRFFFLRPPGAVISELLPGINPALVPRDQEADLLLTACLIDDNKLVLSCIKELVQKSDDWEQERRAYKQIIMHLEAQLAEARRLLSDKARLLKRGQDEAELRSHLFQALSGLQRDGFLDADLDLEDLEYNYLTVFAEEDALRAFAFSPNCPLRPVWRKMCADPKRMRRYIEDLQNHVLRPYRIRAERLSSPFWATKVLRDPRFLADSSQFAVWAKDEPWCEDDAERWVYLTSKLIYKSAVEDEFLLLFKPVPTEPPSRERGTKTVAEMQNSFAKSRPPSFMATADAQDAIRRFKERQSKGNRNLPSNEASQENAGANSVPPKMTADEIPSSQTETHNQSNGAAVATSQEVAKSADSIDSQPEQLKTTDQPVAEPSQTADAVTKDSTNEDQTGAKVSLDTKSIGEKASSAEKSPSANTPPPVPQRQKIPSGNKAPPSPGRAPVDSPSEKSMNEGASQPVTEPTGSAEQVASASAPGSASVVSNGSSSAPALPPNKPAGDGSFKGKPPLPPGKPRRASELARMSVEELQALVGPSATGMTRDQLEKSAITLLKQDEELL